MGRSQQLASPKKRPVIIQDLSQGVFRRQNTGIWISLHFWVGDRNLNLHFSLLVWGSIPTYTKKTQLTSFFKDGGWLSFHFTGKTSPFYIFLYPTTWVKIRHLTQKTTFQVGLENRRLHRFIQPSPCGESILYGGRNSRGSPAFEKSIPFYMGVSENRGTPKWMVYKGKPY